MKNNIINKLASNILKALAHPIRLHILKLLKDKSLCVCEILEDLNSEQSNTSQHLNVLKNAGLVESHKEGLKVIYSVKDTTIFQVIDLIDTILLNQLEETKSLLQKD